MLRRAYHYLPLLLATSCVLSVQVQALESSCDDKPFELFTVGAAQSSLNNKQVQACDRAFFIGGKACTFCPSDPEIVPECKEALNTTVFLLPDAMDVVVPGGQVYYVQTNGALGFSQAHSASIPPGAIEDIFKVDPGNGDFSYANAVGWLACPGTTAGQFQIFANIPAKDSSAGCIPLHLKTKPTPSGSFGAWQYD